MYLERRPDAKQVVPRQDVAANDRMRIPDLDRDELDALADEVDRLVVPDPCVTELLAHEPVRRLCRRNPSSGRLDLHLREAAVAKEPGRRDPGPVPRHLRGRAVGIPDRDLRPRAFVCEHLEDAVAADPDPGIAEPADSVGRERAAVGLRYQQVRVAERVPLLEPHREEARCWAPLRAERRRRSRFARARAHRRAGRCPGSVASTSPGTARSASFG